MRINTNPIINKTIHNIIANIPLVVVQKLGVGADVGVDVCVNVGALIGPKELLEVAIYIILEYF